MRNHPERSRGFMRHISSNGVSQKATMATRNDRQRDRVPRRPAVIEQVSGRLQKKVCCRRFPL